MKTDDPTSSPARMTRLITNVTKVAKATFAITLPAIGLAERPTSSARQQTGKYRIGTRASPLKIIAGEARNPIRGAMIRPLTPRKDPIANASQSTSPGRKTARQSERYLSSIPRASFVGVTSRRWESILAPTAF